MNVKKRTMKQHGACMYIGNIWNGFRAFYIMCTDQKYL